MKKNYCVDCNKEICEEATRCRSCSKKGEFNPRFGKKFFEHSKRIRKLWQEGDNYRNVDWKEVRKKQFKNCDPWNKGLTKEDDERIKRMSGRLKGFNKTSLEHFIELYGLKEGKKKHKEYREKISDGNKNKHCSKKTKKKISESLKKYNKSFEGLKTRKESSKIIMKLHKKGLYKHIYNNCSHHSPQVKYKRKNGEIIYLDSSWELKIANELDKNSINWIRPLNKNGHVYRWIDKDGNQHTYYPDFYLSEFEIYLDPKNPYLQKLDEDKIERVQNQNNIKILILNKKELTWNEIKCLI